jgi:NitT/TauT family transport system substrate-binding protein
MASRLTPFSRILITLLILGALFFGIRYLLNNTELGDKIKSSAENIENTASTETTTNTNQTNKPDGTTKVSDDDALVVQVFTWGGYAPGIYFNEGFKSSPRSRYMRDYGLNVEFKLIDDFDASRQAWIADEVHLLGNEVSAMATEMERLASQDPRVFMQVDWSRGGDAIIGRRGIKSINDLKGKSVAVTPSTPSQTFLLFALESAGLKLSDVKSVEVPSAIDAATAFKSGKVDAAVVWSPDDIFATRDVPGSSILQSTREASHIIADVFMVKASYADKYPEKLAKFYEGWMRGAAEMNANASNMEKASKILADGTGLPPEDALGMIQTTRLTNHGDNLNFFGMNASYKGVTGESLYNKMGDEFEKLGFAPKNRPSWRTLSYAPAISAAKLSGREHLAEGQKEFAPAKAADVAKSAISSKPISINFQTGSSVVSENAKTIIDLQFADVAKAYGNSRIRVEGNTDITGSRETNIQLSKARAESVAKYLQQQYQMTPNRFIIVGNGPDKPVPGCETSRTPDCLSKNRRTEFQLLAD